jgi:hypothetical protein
MKIDEPFVYLTVAEDRRFFTKLTNEKLAKCATDFYMRCPSNMMLRKSSVKKTVYMHSSQETLR